MRTTVTLKPDLIADASRLTGIENKSDVVNEALELLVRVEAGRRLAALGGSDPDARISPRRRGSAS
ncbi:MAG: type II toxin-antitoxin system VapB family antitoxin [Propionibacteriaceae bacterium]|jgi:Arc/MetJ family transcription regulator|nr:type II toxin-antitoxin system VapB family antitoxin [Propionibacteriaceae bacterium]